MASKSLTRLAALIALIAMITSIVGTGALIIFETYFSSSNQGNVSSKMELDELLENYSGILVSSGNNVNNSINNSTGVISLTGATK